MNKRLIFLLPLLVPALNGCFRNTAPIRFYMLRPLTPAESPQAAIPRTDRGPVIGLGPIRLSDYLDRPQIVTAVSEQEYRLAEDHRWAERLDQTLTRVMAENLSVLVPTERVVFHPWPHQQKVDAQVTVNIQEFHVDAAGQVRLAAQWAVRRGDKMLVTRKSSCRLAASGADYAKIVDAQSQCVGQLSREIATSVRLLLGSPRDRQCLNQGG
ncbi:MAG: PqiC family protein [Gammaproteobacteria bacterium]